ncbi:hypothetical protein P280DRAFT_513409 [Massarina eburnea CBS 473.64]|uniref:Uncharacterized protein n=1 Tax=Massarina eburnea CBS 473.64 TaxID=1395130 RepID=A0A6A6SD86_9PLEO|nr:hypothetical protein P280DRAFT_513409 [Massarina eburnea CBS 473.64]
MPYLLRSRASSYVFSTSSRDIAAFLHTTHRWTATWFDPSKVSDVVTTSCIMETENGDVEFDEHILHPRKLEEGMRKTLGEDGFDNVQIEYVGRLKVKENIIGISSSP